MHRWLSHPWRRHLSRLHGSGLSVVGRSLQQRQRAYASAATHWTVLGIETSCDDTAAAVVRRPRRCQPHGGDGTVLSNVVSSQHELTLSYGGVNPLAAYREHQERIDAVVQSALDKAAVSMQELDAIAVTSGPGLAFCLGVGIDKAKLLAAQHSLPLYAINHLEAHALVVRLQQQLPFPFMTLLVSGGHSQILDCRALGDYRLLGTTRDDSLGEAFDKVARMLAISPVDHVTKQPIHAGQALEHLARAGDPRHYAFTIPMLRVKGMDFSFSGLKAQARRFIEQHDITHDPQATCHLAASFQSCAFAHLLRRVKLAVSQVKPTRMVVAGGVARNEMLRQLLHKLAAESHVALHYAPPEYCTDNGAMIAWCALERLGRQVPFDQPDSIDRRPRWPLDPNKDATWQWIEKERRQPTNNSKDTSQQVIK